MANRSLCPKHLKARPLTKRGTCHVCDTLNWYKANRKTRSEVNRAYRNRIKQEVTSAYGGKCNCCGESLFEFLALDHVNGRWVSGVKDLATGDAMYRRAKLEGFPPKYQILCHNCNCAKGFYGACPHEKVMPVSQIA